MCPQNVPVSLIVCLPDAGQSEHFQNIYAAGRMAGWYDPSKKRVEHIGFGLVLGEDNKRLR